MQGHIAWAKVRKLDEEIILCAFSTLQENPRVKFLFEAGCR